jgi:hypothetical protein
MSDTESLAAALASAQGLFVNPERNRTVQVTTKTGGKYTFKYATLDTVMDVIRAPLASNGLAISHAISREENGGWSCITRLLHSSGQTIECPVPIIVEPNANAQGWGSAITYAKRYGICALLAIAADEDDDGNAACGNHAEQVQKPISAVKTKSFDWLKADSPQRRERIEEQIREAGKDAVALVKIGDKMQKIKASDMTPQDMSKVLRDWSIARIGTIRCMTDPIFAHKYLTEFSLELNKMAFTMPDLEEVRKVLVSAEADIMAETSATKQ